MFNKPFNPVPRVIAVGDPAQPGVIQHHLLYGAGPVSGDAVDLELEILYQRQKEGLASKGLHC